MLGAIGESPREPAVDRAEGELAALGPRAQRRIAVEQPRQLRAGKIGIEQQAGAARDLGLVAVCLQASAVVRGAPVLPHDGGRHRATGGAVPEDRRLSLVRDADGHDVVGRRACTGQHLCDGCSLCCPDLLCVVLDPAGAREVLRELALCGRDDDAVVVEQDRSGTGRALVQGEHESTHAADLQRSCKPTTSRTGARRAPIMRRDGGRASRPAAWGCRPGGAGPACCAGTGYPRP